jgi:hypothetical protein
MGMVNANELRRADNLPDIGDKGSEYWRPSNMAVAGEPVTAPQGMSDNGQDEQQEG